MASALPIVLQHHECFDGSGYPAGLAGDAIDLTARIFAVADCYDAISSDRPYRSGLPSAAALERVRRQAGHQFDPEVVQALERVLGNRARTEHTARP
jgi:HD-GYP domain-containing protein (c-di-GMP phosphodiesterase class II)